MVKNTFFALLAAAIFTLCCAPSAFAGKNDFDLKRLCEGGDCTTQASLDQFRSFSHAYSSILAPMHFAPAKTLGQAGFELGIESKMSFSTQDDPSWKATNKNVDPNGTLKQPIDDQGNYAAPDVFATIQLRMRKGLPFSLELEGVFNWLADSEMFYVGGGLRWAITEGWWFLPDISVRGHVGTVVGAAQLSLINVNVDVAISYTWGLGGIAAITPYAGYSLLNSWASSRPLAFYQDGANYEGVFGRITNHLSRGFVGVEIKGDVFTLGIEGEFGKEVMSVGAKIAAGF